MSFLTKQQGKVSAVCAALVFKPAVCYKFYMRLFYTFCLFLILLSFTACATKAELTDTMTPAEMVQRAQEASDRNRYNLSLEYYQAILDRFPTNIEYVCAAEYEIALIHSKQKKYDLAESEFNKLLARYEAVDAELLPPQYKILTEIVMARIEEKTVKSKNKS
jgi:tetratricopeptide (TPR) repeat protein